MVICDVRPSASSAATSGDSIDTVTAWPRASDASDTTRSAQRVPRSGSHSVVVGSKHNVICCCSVTVGWRGGTASWRAATLAGYVVEIGGGDGERPVVAVESTRGLRKGVDVVLTASDGWPRRAYAVAVDARVPDPITEVQLLRCARSHADSEDETFTLTFQGLESPPIKLGAAPTPAVLPASWISC